VKFPRNHFRTVVNENNFPTSLLKRQSKASHGKDLFPLYKPPEEKSDFEFAKPLLSE
jgi:hypothetical protein